MKPLLDLQNVSVTYLNKKKEVYACKNISFSLNAGDSLGIVGESGSGKSTLAMALLRLLPEHNSRVEGQAFFDDVDLLSLTEEQYKALRWDEIAVVFQKSMNSLSPVHRISDQITDIYRVHKPQATKEEIKARMLELLSAVNLSERVWNLYPHELSGGMLQRISIAISLLHDPKLLILDESTTALDVVTQGQILTEIMAMEETMHMTRVMITHDISVVAQACSKVAIMYAGELMEFGLVEEIIKYPKHPYSQALIQSFPSLYGEKKPIESIPGFIPDLSKKVDGCIFASRCPYAQEICKTKKPVASQDGARTVYCHKAGGDPEYDG